MAVAGISERMQLLWPTIAMALSESMKFGKIASLRFWNCILGYLHELMRVPCKRQQNIPTLQIESIESVWDLLPESGVI